MIIIYSAGQGVGLGKQFYYGTETLESCVAELGPNLLIGSFRPSKVPEKTKK